MRDCVCIRYDVSGAGAPWRWACVGNIRNFICWYVCVTVGSACTVHDECLIFFFHFLSEFAKLYFACILTRGLNNSGTVPVKLLLEKIGYCARIFDCCVVSSRCDCKIAKVCHKCITLPSQEMFDLHFVESHCIKCGAGADT